MPVLTAVFVAVGYDKALLNGVLFFLTAFIYGELYRVVSLTAPNLPIGPRAVALIFRPAGRVLRRDADAGVEDVHLLGCDRGGEASAGAHRILAIDDRGDRPPGQLEDHVRLGAGRLDQHRAAGQVGAAAASGRQMLGAQRRSSPAA